MSISEDAKAIIDATRTPETFLAKIDLHNVRKVAEELLALEAALPHMDEGEAVAWRWRVANPHYNDVYQYCHTKVLAEMRANGRNVVEPLYLHPAPAGASEGTKGRFAVEHDGFVGTEIGQYETLEGKRGKVLQQDGTRVVHVYRDQWCRECP